MATDIQMPSENQDGRPLFPMVFIFLTNTNAHVSDIINLTHGRLITVLNPHSYDKKSIAISPELAEMLTHYLRRR